MNETEDRSMAGVFIIILALGIYMVWLMVGPIYSVWQQEQEGKAELAKAEYSRQVAVVESKAKFDSSAMLADAEVRRAEGVAQANQIIGKSLEGNEAYLRYLWINNLEASQNQIIYVPTEAGLPLLEASRLTQQK